MNEKEIEQAIYIAGLLARKREGRLAAGEEQQLEEWLAASESNRRLYERIADQEQLAGRLEALEQYDTARYITKVLSQVAPPAAEAPPPVLPARNRRWIPYAAAVVLLAGAALLWLLQDRRPPAHTAPLVHNTITPGGNKAVLTLSDGTHITLDSAGTGALARQGSTSIVKLDSGRLAYQANGSQAKAAYNTLATPRGGQYMIILPDGSRVWLNAASALKYPVAFTGPERRVQLTGEAYFEIAQHSAQPFYVNVKMPQSASDMEVAVLGTHFNITAYNDEMKVRTTLLEGAVKVKHGSDNRRLLPGEQAAVAPAGAMEVTRNVDTDAIIAWKNGLFHFKGATLQDIMRQISRWYDVEVVWQGSPDIRMSGIINRDMDIKEVLLLLESNGARFRIAGKRIIVL